MPEFEVKMKHSEDSFTRLSHMQYDLFCMRNRIARSLFSAVLIVIAVMYTNDWFTYIIIAYACYLLTSTYASANRVAHKMTQQLKEADMDFPASRFVFSEDALHIFSLPENEELSEPLRYEKVAAFGEDAENFYIFRDRYGGYLIPKKELGDKAKSFRGFIEKKTGSLCRSKRTRLGALRNYIRKRENEPYHL